MDHYKSWSGLQKQLNSFLCPSLQGRITYFLTYYHAVHNSYGRAAIRLDGNELACFSWIDMFRQENDISDAHADGMRFSWDDPWHHPVLKEKWDQNGTYCDIDFLNAALTFLQMPVADALNSDDYIVRILAIMDRRTGKRTLRHIFEEGVFKDYPAWVRQFYMLRFAVEGIEDQRN
jgi:hypothetical protein